MIFTHARRRIGLLLAATALGSVCLLSAAPAFASGIQKQNCGSGTTTATTSRSSATLQLDSGTCGTLYARSHYTVSTTGATYWTGYSTGSSIASSNPGYTVDNGGYKTSKTTAEYQVPYS